MSRKPKKQLAREHFERALTVIEDDPVNGVHWLFVALEAAIDALAAEEGIKTGKSHLKRVQAAEALEKAEVVKEQTSELLELLNEARKETEYEGGDLDLEDWDLEDVVSEVKELVELAEAQDEEGGNES